VILIILFYVFIILLFSNTKKLKFCSQYGCNWTGTATQFKQHEETDVKNHLAMTVNDINKRSFLSGSRKPIESEPQFVNAKDVTKSQTEQPQLDTAQLKEQCGAKACSAFKCAVKLMVF